MQQITTKLDVLDSIAPSSHIKIINTR